MKNKKTMGVYKITNNQNNKMYVGSSGDIFSRWGKHIWDLDNDRHHSYRFQKDWELYDVTQFRFEILEIVEDKNILLDVEQKWMDYYNCYEEEIGYNISISSKEKKTKLQAKIEQDKIDKLKREELKKSKPQIINIKPEVKKEEYVNKYADDENEVIRAIANLDVEFLKNKINYPPTYHILRKDCMKEILNYDYSWIFDNKCFLCKEKTPFLTKSKDWGYLYNCKCYHSKYNIVNVFEIIIGKYVTRPINKKFLLDVFNMTYDEKESKIQEDLELENLRNLPKLQFKKKGGNK